MKDNNNSYVHVRFKLPGMEEESSWVHTFNFKYDADKFRQCEDEIRDILKYIADQFISAQFYGASNEPKGSFPKQFYQTK